MLEREKATVGRGLLCAMGLAIGCGGRTADVGGEGTGAVSAPEPARPLSSPNDAGTCGICAGKCTDHGCLVTISKTGGQPAGIAVGGGYVYWADPELGLIMKAPAAGGSPITLVTDDQSPTGVALFNGEIFWTDIQGVSRVGVEGGTPTQVAAHYELNGDIAVDAAYVYWGIDDIPGGLWRVGSRESGATGREVAHQRYETQGVSLDSTYAYWVVPDKGAVRRKPIAGGEIEVISNEEIDPWATAVNGGYLYWVTRGDLSQGGTVRRVPVTGGAPETIADGQDDPRALALDATDVYWVNYGGSVVSAPLAGGTATTLARDQTNASTIAVGAHSVYWASPNGFVRMLTPR